MPKLFISYRREDSNNISGRIYDRLIQEFSKTNIFKDVDSIPLGSDFRQILSEAVSRCDVLLSVIGKHWLDATDRAGKRRLDAKSDFVRVEIEAALERGIPVIPVLVDGASVPDPEELPSTLRDLSFRNGTSIRHDPDFHRDMDRLVAWLKHHKKKRTQTGVDGGGRHTSLARSFWVGTVSLLVITSGILGAYFWWPSGPGPAGRKQPKAGPQDTGSPTSEPIIPRVRVDLPRAPTGETVSPGPPQPRAPAKNDPAVVERAAAPADDAAITATFDKMPKSGSRDSIRVALWIASSITKRDLPIFDSLAASMRDGDARLSMISFPDKSFPKVLNAGIDQVDDPRRFLDRQDVDVVIIYGIYREGAIVPDGMNHPARSRSQLTHLALMWCSQVGKDSFLILPDEDLSIWIPSHLSSNQRVFDAGEGDAVEAAIKYNRIINIGNKAQGNDFRDFFRSVRTRTPGPSQISNLVE